jgi:hypothetical protein
MAHSLALVGFLRGRELFVFVAAMSGTLALHQLMSGQMIGLLFGLVALACLQPVRTRPASGQPWVIWLAAASGAASWFLIQFGLPALLRRLG